MKKLFILTGASGNLGREIYKLKKTVDTWILICNKKKINADNDDFVINCDFTLDSDMQKLCNKLYKIMESMQFNEIIFIHAAGKYCKTEWDNMFTDSIWIEQIKISVLSLIKIINVILKFENKFEKGNFIGISTNLVEHSNYGTVPYVSTKGYLEFIIKLLAKELGKKKIVCNCIEPGLFLSDVSVYDNNKINKIIENTPLKRLTYATDIVDIIEFLLSDKSNWITGNVIIADGGNRIGY